MKIGVLTSSRADFGIYLPLLRQLREDSFFKVEIIAFGTHLSKFHGFTINNIIAEGFSEIHTVSALLTNDDEQSISTAYALTGLKFADFWAQHNYDLVLCLGDRFEMSAAVQAGIPFGVKFAHFHGGETTLGAIDNIYRHQISLASSYHFTATELFSQRVREIVSMNENVYTVGSLSLDGFQDIVFRNEAEFRKEYGVFGAYALVTFHPETVFSEDNTSFANEMFKALKELTVQLTIVVTMPNADTAGTLYRDRLLELRSLIPDKIILIENFGKENYFSAMHYAECLIGNTSSGIIEAASFGKYVVNVGSRQSGRAQSANTVDCEFSANKILEASASVLTKGLFTGENIYYKPNSANTIIAILKSV